MKWLIGITLLVFLSLVWAAPTPFADSGRLPKTTLPISYDLEITTEVDAGFRAFSGTVKITFSVEVATNLITLHNRGLSVDENIILRDSEGASVQLAPGFSFDTDYEWMIVQTMLEMPAGSQYTIEISYTGMLNLTPHGFYRSSYRSGTFMRFLAVTQFEDIDARHAFPCYDEPEFKATFTLKINHGSSYNAVSNTQGTKVDNGGGSSTTTFATTPKMSTYLLAFIVSDFESITNEGAVGEGETLHKFYARTDVVEKTRFALNNSVKFLKTLQDYVKFEYELNTMFSAAVPDFQSWAMENWGLTYYKEQCLILDENPHPREIFDSMRIMSNVIGHQFFGNVATMKWWDQMWLNEGMSALFEYRLVELVYPEARAFDMFNLQKLQNGFKIDVESAHPMNFEGNYIYGIFYDKTSSIVRMFQYAVGEDIFRDSLSLYLRNNEYRSVISSDLHQAFDDTFAINGFNEFKFADAFITWESQKGYPLVKVLTDDVNSIFSVTQARYYTEYDERVMNDERSWFIPLNYATQSDPNFSDTSIHNYFVNGEPMTTISYPAGFNSNQWFVFNKQQLGYYRVNYDTRNWNALINVLNSDDYQQIHVLNRAQLIDDSLNFAADGYLDYQTAFKLLTYLNRETDYIPWRAAANNLEKIEAILKGRPIESDFKTFLKQLVRKMYVTYGLEEKPEDTLVDKLGRELAIDLTCRMGDKGCAAQTYEQLKALALEGRKVEASLEIAIICNGLRGLNKQDEFAALWRRLQASDDQAERLRLIDGLLCSSDLKLIKDLLEATITNSGETFLRAHERSRIASNVYVKSSAGLEAMAELLTGHFNESMVMFAPSNIDSLILSMSKRVCIYEDQIILSNMLDNLEGKLQPNTKTDAMKNIDNNKVWIESSNLLNVQAALTEYFADQAVIENQLRLPTNSKPRSYKIHLDVTTIQTGETAFTGEVEIDVLVREASDYIMFHSKNQVIDDLQVVDKITGDEVNVLDYHLYPEADTITIYFMNQVEANSELLVTIKYSTNLLTGRITGFYQTSYTMDGLTRYLGATQFEETGGRYAFPHYDEPGYKAVFELSITHDASVNAIANTEGTRNETNADGSITTTFEPSPVMSSYLLAFIVSDLESITNENEVASGETVHRVWVRPDSKSKAQYALDTSVAVLKALETYTGFKYEMSKVDSVGVPGKTNAMENWGLVKYRENAMIYEENPDDIAHDVRLSGVDVISHELAHQFFGDSVTCEWWDYIWLNEGFATLFEYHLTDMLHPEWRTRAFFNLRRLQNAFIGDTKFSAKPMTRPIITPEDIDGAFDYVAYDKAGSVLRMFQNAVGETVFRAALQLYLETNDHMPVNSQHLMDAFENTMREQNIRDMAFGTAFRTWERQAGYPVVKVTIDGAQQFQMTQMRFLDHQFTIVDNSNWYIPLNFAFASNPNFVDTTITNYFNNGLETFSFNAPAELNPNEWFIFNKQQLGYYRVNYDINNWNKLIQKLNSETFEEIHVLNRAQLVDDALNLASFSHINYQTAFELLTYLKQETDYVPWKAAINSLDKLDYIFKDSPIHGNFTKFIRQLARKMHVTYGLEMKTEDTLVDQFARELAIDLTCRMGDERCAAATYKELKPIALEGKKVHASQELSFICNGMRGLNKQAEFVALWNRLLTSNHMAERFRLIDGILCSSDPIVIKDLLLAAVANSEDIPLRQDEKSRIVNNVFIRSSVGFTSMINLLSEYYNDFVETFSASTVDSVIISMSRRIRTDEDQAVLIDLIDSLEGKLKPDTQTLALENIASNQWLFDLSYNGVKTILDAYFAAQSVVENQLRLPMIAKPRNYKLDLDVKELQTGKTAFTGTVVIDILVLETTKNIIFHSKNQIIDDLHVVNKITGDEILVHDYHLYPEADTITIYFWDEVKINSEIIVTIKYSSNLLTDSATGFYQTSYVMNGERRYLGATQFEPARARNAFPHYDEPGYKAVFELSITHDASVNAIANTFGVMNITNIDGSITTTFEPSPVMSSYLLAFIVSDLESITNENEVASGETVHRVWVRPDSKSKAQYALDTSVAVLKALETYTGFKYEISKVDSAGVPNKGGAMENWGMVTYRENAMIYEENPDDISHEVKLSGVDVISHELAHQFFGDSVTCEWWDYIWLNEGFATLFEFHLTDILYPEWRTRAFFNLRALQNAFIGDSKRSARPMTKPLLTTVEISGGFDYVAYDKAGSVLRMFQNAVGETVFRAALQLYLETNDHMPVNSQHLMDAFENTMRELNVRDIAFGTAFRTWERQAGFPIIHVSADQSQFHVTQRRFFGRNESESSASNWYIPLNFAFASNPNFDDTSITNYFNNGLQSFSFNTPAQFDANEWFIFNKQQLGYYRVNYDVSNWDALIQKLNSETFESIHELNRAQLLDDSFALASTGTLSYDVVFGLLSYLVQETEYTPWKVADKFISELYDVFGPMNDVLNALMTILSDKFYQSFKLPADETIPVEGVYERFSRELSAKIACKSGNAACLEDAFILVKNHANDIRSVPKGMENVVFCNGFRGVNKQDEFVKMWRKMQASSDEILRSQIINGLGCTEDPDALKDYLVSTLGDGNNVQYTLDERHAVFSAVLKSFSGLEAVINFMTESDIDIMRNYRWTLQEMMTVTALTVSTIEQKTRFMEYLSSLEDLPAETFQNISTIADANLQLQQEPINIYYSGMIRWLLSQFTGETTLDTTTTTQATPTTTSTTQATPTTTTTTQITTSTTNQVTTPTTTQVTTPTTTQITTPTTVTTEATTEGAASIGIKLVTLLASLLLAFVFKF